MTDCEVLIVGGGPAGSSCAWRLRRAGFDVVVMDKSVFPRDKLCGGWITPQVIADISLDVEEYRRGRTLQPITGFLTRMIGSDRFVETDYGRAVSFGIRRCEFDDYLLRRAGARLMCGTPVADIRRDGDRWIVNGEVAARMLVGAGGHFCPIARLVNQGLESGAPIVVAREVEFDPGPDAETFATRPAVPELYFCPDLKGYGWCFRKANYINIGLGRADRRLLPGATAAFVGFLERTGRVPRKRPWPWRGHAYLLHDGRRRRVVDAGVLLIGDAAGLAFPQSGEGIRPAVESGLLAARTIHDARGQYTAQRLEPYERALDALRASPRGAAIARAIPPRVWLPISDALLRTPAFVRHVALDRWFLRANTPPIAAA
jgi:flavin-dependent dehydrogenase